MLIYRKSNLLLGLCLLLLAGCQAQNGYNTGKPATNWNPFAGWGQSRVPPPGTNAYGTSTLAPTQGYTVPAGTPFAPVPPGGQAPLGGVMAPGPGGFGGASNINMRSTVPQASKPVSLGPAQSTPIRRASYEDPAAQFQAEAQPASGTSTTRTDPAPANKMTPY